MIMEYEFRMESELLYLWSIKDIIASNPEVTIYDTKELFERLAEITPSIAYHLYSGDQATLKAIKFPRLKQVKGTKDAHEVKVLVRSSKSAKLLIKNISSCERRKFSLQQTAVSTTKIDKSKANNHVSREVIFPIQYDI